MQFHASVPQTYADKVYLMIYAHRRAATKNESQAQRRYADTLIYGDGLDKQR